ncbi:MAG: hypothetical protein VB031_02000 [Eubacteriaceae bacterium]|nr:hypothetical protein [Eubacteriaceae bacterium]
MKRMKKEILVCCTCILAVAGLVLYRVDPKRFGEYSGFMTPIFVIVFTEILLLRTSKLITGPNQAKYFARKAHKT